MIQIIKTKISVLLCSIIIAPLMMCHQALAESEPPVVVLFGDSLVNSISQTLQVRHGDGQVNLGEMATELDSLLDNFGRSSIVASLGEGGTPSGPSSPGSQGANLNGSSRADADFTFVKNLHPGESYYTLILYGSNDYAYGVSPSDTKFNIQQIIDSARNQDISPAVGTVPPHFNANMDPYNVQIIAAAASRNTKLVDINSVITLDMLWDSLHPTPEGYRLIAKKWFDDYLKVVLSNGIGIAGVIGLLLEEDSPPPPKE